MRTVHVLLHIVQSSESLSTDQAHVPAGMHATMVGVLAATEELLSADGTVVRFLSGMVTPVLQQLTGSEELLCTYIADERPVTSMLASVLGHRAEPRKSTATDIAVERTFTGMCSPVLGILFSAYERLPAVVADVDHSFSSGNRLL